MMIFFSLMEGGIIYVSTQWILSVGSIIRSCRRSLPPMQSPFLWVYVGLLIVIDITLAMSLRYIAKVKRLADVSKIPHQLALSSSKGRSGEPCRREFRPCMKREIWSKGTFSVCLEEVRCHIAEKGHEKNMSPGSRDWARIWHPQSYTRKQRKSANIHMTGKITLISREKCSVFSVHLRTWTENAALVSRT